MDDDSSTMQRWTARDGQLTKNGLAMEQWTARDGQLGAMDGSAMDGLSMDGSAIKRWTARQ
jgi:hypothetical protein